MIPPSDEQRSEQDTAISSAAFLPALTRSQRTAHGAMTMSGGELDAVARVRARRGGAGGAMTMSGGELDAVASEHVLRRLGDRSLVRRHTAPAPGGLSVEERSRLLSGLNLFHELDVAHLHPLAAAATQMEFERGEALMRQGEAGDSVFVIVDGQVEVRAHRETDGEAQEVVLARLGGGDAVGELALLDGGPRSATCVALSRTRCLMLHRDTFLQALRRNWALNLRLLQQLSQRLRLADYLITEQARDPLTSLGTKRALEVAYRQLAEQAAQALLGEGSSVALIFADVNQLRQINECYGRPKGDTVLRVVAQVLGGLAEGQDLVVRYGGDEFVVLLNDASLEQADAFAAEANALLTEESDQGLIPFTVSFGTAVSDPSALPPLEQLVLRADLRAYRQKAHVHARQSGAVEAAGTTLPRGATLSLRPARPASRSLRAVS